MKYYFLFFLIFCFLVGGGFYTLNSQNANIAFFSFFAWDLPVALWIVFFLSIFFICSLFFFTSNWLSRYIFSCRLDKDSKLLVEQVFSQILQKEENLFTFKTKTYQVLSKILYKTSLTPRLNTPSCDNEKIDSLFLELEELEKGNVLKRNFKKDTYFWKRNMQNRMQADLKFSQKILEDSNEEEEFRGYALKILLQNNALSEKIIHKLLNEDLKEEMAREILVQFLEKGYKLSIDDLFHLMLCSKSSALQILDFAKKIKQAFDPDYCITLFSKLVQKSDEARMAYVFILLDFSMKDKAKEFLLENEDLVLPRAYIELQEMGKIYPLELFFS